jgi:transaldolase
MNSEGTPVVFLNEKSALESKDEKITLSEKQFRWMHNEDEMAVEKLSEGIRKFAADSAELENLIRQKISEKN